MAVKIVQKKLTVKSLVEKIFSVQVSGGHGPDDLSDSHFKSLKSIIIKATALHNAGCELHVTMTRLAIKCNNVFLGIASLKMAAVTLCMQHKLGAVPTKIIRSKIIGLINDSYQKNLDLKLVDQSYPEVKDECMHHIKNENKIAAIKVHRNLTGASLKLAKAAVDIWWDEYWDNVKPEKLDINSGTKAATGGTTVEENKIFEKDWGDLKTYPGHHKYATDLGAKVISLSEATVLHQAVAGTSASSRYHVIALGEGIAVAVRIDHDNSVALRAALRVHPNSKIGQQAKTALLEAGLDKKTAGHYSLHLTPDSPAMVKRCIGATLFAISSLDQISGQLPILLEKGS